LREEEREGEDPLGGDRAGEAKEGWKETEVERRGGRNTREAGGG